MSDMSGRESQFKTIGDRCAELVAEARRISEGGREQATWCVACFEAWPGHVLRDGHSLDRGDKHQVGWLDFTAAPPVDGKCHCCDDWREFPEGQKHFGFAWWRNGERREKCDHAHHAEEVWYA